MQSAKIIFTFLLGFQLSVLPSFAQNSKSAETSPNVATVKVLYELFGKGDIPTLLSMLDDNIVWDSKDNPIVPGSYFEKKTDVANFFMGLGGKAEFSFFQPTEFVETGNTVVAIGSQKYRLKSDNKEYHSNWMMQWKFRDGKPVYFKELFDVEPLK